MSLGDELEKLAELRSRGILSDTEFEAQKEQVLRQLGKGPDPHHYLGTPPQYSGFPYSTPQPWNTPPLHQSTNGMAIASMVLGILWVGWVGSVLALVFGYIGLNQIRERNEQGRGMAIAGVVLGWVGVGFLVFFIVAAIVGAATASNGV